MAQFPRAKEARIFKDNAVTGDFVRLSATAAAIVDTPIFQRLRHLKQLGMTEYVYPTATHTRFVHSLGVAHRAKEFALKLWQKQPELQLTDSDLIVLEVAGLCHDIGHGPFSHSFQTELVPKLLPPGQTWEHEAMSCLLVDHICQQYNIDLCLDEQTRVKDLIAGDRVAAVADWTGKEWQFDIVANKRNGLDVDKLDYLKRDSHGAVELTTSDTFSFLYENMRVINGEVCFRTSVRSVVQEVYSARAKLHEFVYTHPVAKAVEYMVTDALLLVADELRILDALRDPERFVNLHDAIILLVENSSSQTPGMQAAQELLRRLRHRDIYKHCGSADVQREKVSSFLNVKEEEILEHQDPAAAVTLTARDIRVHNLKIDYTTQHENPLKHVGFYVNDSDQHPHQSTDNPFAPGTFITRQVRVYLVRLCDSSEEKRQYQQAVQHAFDVWSRKVLRTEFVMSPAKSTVTASARKRAHPSSSQHGATAATSEFRRPAEAAAADGEAGEDAEDVAVLSQNGPPAKKGLLFAQQ
ncbi:hypothetical protein D9Q98_007345 [Chlorella vulgaris]|uniref:HD domain-containing protein n=1 Tax=Chlorella vulgaris TaxID=3077 RepID=A0A9D4TL53_CHLVU|nr:hypothetical protein D9Q98_007345 [Chlorella vulgaris]